MNDFISNYVFKQNQYIPLGLSGGAFELEPAVDVVAPDELPTAAFDESLCCVRGIRLAFKLGCIANSVF